MPYKPRSSQTRHGQRVDNPEPPLTDTAELRVLVREATQDIGEEQERINRKVLSALDVNLDRWRSQFQKDKDLADKRDVKYLWIAIGLLAGACATVGAALFAMIRELERRP